MSLAWVAVGSVVAGTAVSINAANKAQKGQEAAIAASANAAEDNAAIASRQVDLAEKQYADQKALLDEYAPLFKQQIQLSTQEQQKSIERGEQQWASYRSDFAPLESKLASTALNFDSPQRRDQAAGEAVGQVSSAFDIARAGTRRSLADAGVKVGSGTATALDAQSRIEQAKAASGASNQARRAVETQGLSLVDNAARFGRGMPSTGIQTAALAGQQGQQAQAGYQGLSSATAQPAATAAPLYNSAVGANNSAGSLYLNNFGAQTQALNQKTDMYGDIMGGVLKGAGFFSSETLKDVGATVDGKEAEVMVERSPAKRWSYKPGLGDGDTKPRMGPTAESLAKVAPEVSDGTQVDGIAMLGLHHAAIGGQAKRLARIEKRLSLADAKPARKAV